MHPTDLFVFAGAGVSVSPPACLPMFNWLRDEVLTQLHLEAYVSGAPEAETERVGVAAGLAPEPFMLDLRLGGVAVTRWLGQILSGEPNAAHHALGQLARRGAKIWTVNFDRLIEQTTADLDVLAWPASPDQAGELVKPHGTLGGELIVGADQVLRGLSDAWRQRLSEDVRRRIVVFVGYSGRDLDFQPVWDELLNEAREVLWFDQPDRDHPEHVEDETRRRLMLRSVDARVVLTMVAAGAPPDGLGKGAHPNAAADFVTFCVDRGLVDVDPTLIAELYDPLPAIRYPALVGDLDRARASVLGHLGDFDAAQAQRRALLRRRGRRGAAARELVGAAVTNGTPSGRLLLLGARALPPVGRLAALREVAQRKRLTALHREARHEAVLHATRHLDSSSVSTLLILRASALRLLGSLDEAAGLADEALRRARQEDHAIRTAHAAFQKAVALLWAERLDETRRCLEDELRPLASLAANRWVAWAHFVEGGLHVRAGDPGAATRALTLSETLFAAEALMDGVVSARVARLSALRLAGADDQFASEATELVTSRGATTAAGAGTRAAAASPQLPSGSSRPSSIASTSATCAQRVSNTSGPRGAASLCTQASDTSAWRCARPRQTSGRPTPVAHTSSPANSARV